MFHCLESARIYADRLVENVPILSERAECVAMPAEPDSSTSVGKYEPSIADQDAEPGDIMVP